VTDTTVTKLCAHYRPHEFLIVKSNYQRTGTPEDRDLVKRLRNSGNIFSGNTPLISGDLQDTNREIGTTRASIDR